MRRTHDLVTEADQVRAAGVSGVLAYIVRMEHTTASIGDDLPTLCMAAGDHHPSSLEG